MRVFRIIGKAAVAFYDELFFFFLVGLIHTACWLLIIPGPFALAGVYIVGQRAVRGMGVSWGLIWGGVKEFGGRAFLLFLIVLLGYGILASNLWFYATPEVSPFPTSVTTWLIPIWIVLGLLWTGVVFYAQSFLMELEEPRMLLVLRNSLFLTILHPIQTLILVIVSILALVLSIVLPVLLTVYPGFVSVLSLTAVRTLVADLAERADALKQSSEEEGDEEAPTAAEETQEDDEDESLFVDSDV